MTFSAGGMAVCAVSCLETRKLGKWVEQPPPKGAKPSLGSTETLILRILSSCRELDRNGAGSVAAQDRRVRGMVDERCGKVNRRRLRAGLLNRA